MALKLVESCHYCLGRAQGYSHFSWYLLVIDDKSSVRTQECADIQVLICDSTFVNK